MSLLADDVTGNLTINFDGQFQFSDFVADFVLVRFTWGPSARVEINDSAFVNGGYQIVGDPNGYFSGTIDLLATDGDTITYYGWLAEGFEDGPDTLASCNIGATPPNGCFDPNAPPDPEPPNPVPVPAAIWLFGTALIGLVGFGKRRRAA